MPTYPVVLTDTEDLALSAMTISVRDWVHINAKQKAKMVIDDIVKIVVQCCAEQNIAIPSTVDGIVALGFEKGWIEKAKERPIIIDGPPPGPTNPML